MKRRILLETARQIAESHATTFDLVREGANHSVFRCRDQNVIVPRHREINEITAKSILRAVTEAAREQ